MGANQQILAAGSAQIPAQVLFEGTIDAEVSWIVHAGVTLTELIMSRV